MPMRKRSSFDRSPCAPRPARGRRASSSRSAPGEPAIAPPFPWTDRDFAFHARQAPRLHASRKEPELPRAPVDAGATPAPRRRSLRDRVPAIETLNEWPSDRARALRGLADASLRDEVAHRIVSKAGDRALDVEVRVTEGIVVLEGPVPARATKEMLHAIVEACPGVRGVDNRLRVDWVDETPSAARAGEEVASPPADYLSSTSGSPTTTMRRTE
ncbi:MAG: BON domain-containing protein [Betaproteobacteria bacterium]